MTEALHTDGELRAMSAMNESDLGRFDYADYGTD